MSRQTPRRPALINQLDWHVLAILAAALGLRLLVWLTLPYRDWISDEAEYWGAASWLAQGLGLRFFDGWVWSRPPLYVGFLAAHIKIFGNTALWAPRLSQALLGVLAVWLVMRIARRLAPAGRERPVALIAGWAMALSYSFATFTFLLLSETLFLVVFLAGMLKLLAWGGDQRASWRTLAFAGALLGLAALTRAVILTWLPLAALWVLLVAWRRGMAGPRALLPVALLTLSVCAVVLPWSAYATARWGRGDGLILVDTTGGYNFALGAIKSAPKDFAVNDENKLHDLLCGGQICDGAQAARQNAAYAFGWATIRQYPAGYAAKTARELLDMIQMRFGGAERLTEGYSAGAVPAPHLIGLLLDDTLYVLALPLAMVGLLRRSPGRRAGAWLVISWLGYNVVVGALVFAINRFRQPLLPFVFIYAAAALVQWRAPWQSPRRRLAALALAGVLALLVAPSYIYWPDFLEANRRAVLEDVAYSVRGIWRANRCAEIGAALEAGDVAGARRMHDALAAEVSLDCLAVLNGRILQAEGRDEEALAFLKNSKTPDNPPQAAKILMLEGDILRRLGRTRQAWEVFVPREVETVNDTAWAWTYLQPPPTSTLDLGTGLDYGYVLGFYKREISSTPDFRWSGPESAIRFPAAGTGRPQTLRLHVNGYTNNWRPTVIVPRAGGRDLPALTLAAEWQWVEVALPPTAPGADVVVEFASTAFVDGPQDLADRQRAKNSQPLRLLGFQLDLAELRDE